MRRIVSLMCVLALLTPLLPLSLFSLQVYATQNTYNGIQAANELDQFKRIPDSYPSYRVSGDDLYMFARFAYAKFDDLPVQLYMAVDIEKTADNGYILIHERDVESWIAYYGKYNTDEFITHIKTITPEIRVMVGGVPEIFYNHAKIATYAGGSPGEFYFRQLPNGNWEPRVSGIQQYDTVYKHLIEMNMPTNAEVGEEVSISLRIRDGSVFLNQQQFWHLSVTKPDGREYLLHNHRVLPDSFTHEYQEIVKYTFNTTGKYIFKFEIEDGSYHNDYRTQTELYSVTVEVTVGDEEAPGPEPEDPPGPWPDPGPSPGGCSVVIQSPSNGRSLASEVLNPNAYGVIRADSRGNERFDVLQGIPTSESLYANAFGLNYLLKYKFQEKTGKVTYSVPVQKTYVLMWVEMLPPACEECPPTPMPMQDQVVIQENVVVERNYSYWQIDSLEVYSLAQAVMTNYALPGGSVTLHPAGYTPPNFSAQHSNSVNDHVQPAPCQAIDLGVQTIDGGNMRPHPPVETHLFQAEAESRIGKVRVKNDSLTFNGSTVMSGAFQEERTADPSAVPEPTMINQNVLYRPGLVIPSTLQNRANTPSSGTIYYKLMPGGIGGGSDKQFPINGINSVTVHTPTVMYPSISDDREHNQKINPALDRASLILDRTFTVYVPTSGQHRNIPGYGNRDYQKYITIKQVYFPFDVYDAETKQFYAKNQWIDIPVSQQSKTFYLPVWVDEGFYTVRFRSFAENYPSSFTYQTGANLDLAHHVAVNTVDVDVVGRIYDFRITDIADIYWEPVFRVKAGSPEHTPNVYYVGNRDIDGNVVGNRDMAGSPVSGTKLLTLPIRPGSHTDKAYGNWAIKTGYHFKFEVKTKGNMDGKGDAIRIYPTFYFVKKDGTGRISVDLYYHDYTNKRYFIRIGSEQDKLTRYVVLNDKYRNVDQSALQDTARFMADVHDVDNFMQLANRRTHVGTHTWMILPYATRTLHGPKSIPPSVDPYRALGSMQTWYGEYSLPAAVYVVPKGTDLAKWAVHNGGLTDKSSIFLKDGYIIVNFQIETIRNQDLQNPYLRYYPLAGHSYPFNNQWRREGFQYTVSDPKGNTFQLIDGDVVFYHADASSYDDIGVGVTH